MADASAIPSLIVAKPFNSTQRRFRVGTEVSDGDDFSPHRFADLKASGMIVAKVVKDVSMATASFGNRDFSKTL